MKATRTWEIILVFLLLIVVAGFSATTEGFLDFYNLSDSTFNYSEKALIALPMALVIIASSVMAGMLAASSAWAGVIRVMAASTLRANRCLHITSLSQLGEYDAKQDHARPGYHGGRAAGRSCLVDGRGDRKLAARRQAVTRRRHLSDYSPYRPLHRCAVVEPSRRDDRGVMQRKTLAQLLTPYWWGRRALPPASIPCPY